MSDWAADQGLLLLRAEHFFATLRRRCFDAVGRLRQRKQKADIVTVHEETKREGVASIVDLSEMIDLAFLDLHLPYYACCVRKSYLDRQIIAKAEILMSDHAEGVEKADDLRKVCVERESEDSPRVFSLTDNLIETLSDLESKPPPRLSIGIPALNNVLGGIEAGEIGRASCRERV